MQFQSPELEFDIAAPEKIGNLAEKQDDTARNALADHVIELVKIDETSMAEWLGKANGYLDSIDSDTNQSQPQNREQDGSNEAGGPPSTAMTLSAVIQFTARVVGALLSEPDLSRASEPGGEALAAWVSSQLRTVDPDWVNDTDPLVLHMAVTGLGWRKRWFDEHDGQFRSAFLNVNEVIINANAKSLERTPRLTHLIEKYPYEIQRSIELKHWVDYEPDFDDVDPQELQQFYEVDMWLDLDGDGYDEPWTVTLSLEDVPTVVKIVPRWSKKTVVDTPDMLLFRPSRRYYAYKMIPDPKGSFLPRGFGWLLDRSENAADRLLASIIDTAKSAGENGGVAATGGVGMPDKIELKGNRLTTINTDGRPLDQVLSFFPAKQVTPGMFQGLDKVMTMGDRLAGTLNLMENAPASMTATMAKGIIDSGTQVQSAVHRRLIGAITEEQRSFAAMADSMGALPDGVDGKAPIACTADPNMATEMHRGVLAQSYHDMLQLPMVFNPHEVALRYARTMRFPDPEKLIAPPMPAPQPTPAEQVTIQLGIEKEKTARMKANADTALKFSQSILALSQAAEGSMNIDLMRAQIVSLEKTMEALNNDTASIGGNSAGVAGQPPNPTAAGDSSGQAGPGGGGASIGPGGGPDTSGAGNGLSMAGPPAGFAAG